MTLLHDLFAHEFLRHAVVASVLASLLCGVVGTFVVVKRLVFISGGISHAAFGGLGAFLWLGLDPRLGAGLVSVGAALLLSRVREARTGSRDAAIGVLWAVGMALGIAFLAKTPGYAPNLMSYLFGNVLTVRPSDIAWTLALTAGVLAALAFAYQETVAVAFDEDFAALQGVSVRRVNAVLLVLVGLAVVFLIQLVGIVLVIALLTIPPLVALRLVHTFPAVMAVASAVGLVMTLGGLALSYRFDLPSGATMVLLGAALLLAQAALGRIAARRPRPLPAGDDQRGMAFATSAAEASGAPGSGGTPDGGSTSSSTG